MKKLFCILTLAGLLSGCKDDPVKPEPVPDDFNLVDAKIYLSKDALGILHHSIYNFEIGIPGFSDSVGTAISGKALALFFNDVSDTAYSEVGCGVQIGPYSLIQQSNNAYQYLQGTNDSLIYRNPLAWNIACKSIDRSVDLSDFPGKPSNTSEKNISRLSGYTAKNLPVSGADSVIYQLQTTTNTRTRVVQKTLAGNATQCVFTLDDLLTLDASNYALLTITGYRVETDLFDSKKYYSTFQQSTTKLVVVN